MNIFIHLDSGNEEDTLEPVSRELPEELAYGSEGLSSDSDGLVMSSASVHGARIPQVDHSGRPRVLWGYKDSLPRGMLTGSL